MDGPVVFRRPVLGVLAAVGLAVCATPVAFSAPGLRLVYLVPLAVVVWVLRVRTTVDPEAIAVRGVLRTRRVAWGDVTALRLRSSRTRSGVSAVVRGGSELPLPALRPRDLPLLAAASGGRLPDPSGGPAAGTGPAGSTTEPAGPAAPTTASTESPGPPRPPAERPDRPRTEE